MDKHKKYQKTEKFRETQKRYRKTYLGRKARLTTKWRSRGVLLRPDETWEDIFCMWFITENCMICNKVLLENHKCLDHDHKTGFVRSVCCKYCNYDGKIPRT